jgi:hypothetical protein
MKLGDDKVLASNDSSLFQFAATLDIPHQIAELFWQMLSTQDSAQRFKD